MSVNSTAPAMIECDGDGRWPCREFFQDASFCTARETRRSARQAGWRVNIKQDHSRRRLDQCPTHTPAKAAQSDG